MTLHTRAAPKGNAHDAAELPARRLFKRLAWLLAAVAIAAAPAALADARSEARRHYRNGLELLANGQTERAIEEFKAAYAIRPHPDALYNIARAYVDLGNIPEALNYFRRYLANDPEDKEQVVAVMNRLQAAISKAPEKKPDEPKPDEPAQPQATTPAGQMDAQALIAKLQELLGQKPAAAPAAGTEQAADKKPEEKKPDEPADEFEATAITATTRATAQEIAKELAGSARAAQSEDVFEEQVVTAGARASTEEKAPASITIIHEEEIRLSGAMTIPEVLRRVPGIDVAEMNPSDVNVSIRGFNRRVSNKLLVLVDGRSVYQDFLGITIWPLLNVAVQDISRIEVVRGPGSALYGANAFAGVVNIITKTSEERSGANVYAQGGTNNAMVGGLSVTGRQGRFSYRTSVGYDRHDKWTRDQDDALPAWQAQFRQPNRSRELTRAEAQVGYEISRHTKVTAAGGYNNFATEIFPNGAVRTFAGVGEGGFGSLNLTSGETKLTATWNSLRMTAGPEYWPDGIQKFDSRIRSDIVDMQAQTGFEFKALGTHRLNVGGGWRYKNVAWSYLEPHIGSSSAACLSANPDPSCTDRYDENHFNVFLQEQWSPAKKLDVVLGYRLDRHPLLANHNVTTGGLIQSGRGSLIYSLDRDHALRVSVGTSFRAPTFFESYIGVYAPVPHQPGLGVAFNGRRDLRPESILQGEVGWRGRFFDRLSTELVVYAHRATDLILDSVRRAPTPTTAIDPRTGGFIVGFTGFENTPTRFFGVGGEMSARYTPFTGLELGANYSFERIFDCTTSCVSDVSNPSYAASLLANTPQHKVNLLALWRTNANIDVALNAHLVSGVTWVENVFDPSNEAGVTFIPFTLPGYALVNGRVGYRLIKDKLDVGVAVYNLLGDQHREHPYGNQIGRRISLTASGAF